LPRPSQQLTITGVAGAEAIEDTMLDCTTSLASKAFNESRPRCLRRLMSLVLPATLAVDAVMSVNVHGSEVDQVLLFILPTPCSVATQV